MKFLISVATLLVVYVASWWGLLYKEQRMARTEGEKPMSVIAPSEPAGPDRISIAQQDRDISLPEDITTLTEKQRVALEAFLQSLADGRTGHK